jgi:hypothetical protein
MRAKAWGLGAGLVSVVWLATGCSGTNPLQPYQRIEISVAGAGEGGGYVYANDPVVNIHCAVNAYTTGNRCEDGFNDAGEGGVFSLIAEPVEGSVFVGWSWPTGQPGCESATEPVCRLRFRVADGNVRYAITARFELPGLVAW